MKTKYLIGVGLLLIALFLYNILENNIEERNNRWHSEIFNKSTPEWRLIDIHDSMMIDPQTVEELDYKELIKRLYEYDEKESLLDY